MNLIRWLNIWLVVAMTALVDQSSAKSKVEKMMVSITVLIIFKHIYLVAHPTNRKWVITPVIYMG